MENPVEKTGNISGQTAYTPRTEAIPAEIGWDEFMFGDISILWQEIQARYFREIGKENSGLRWTSALIQKIWQVTWDQW
jgi:hypothetical protein